MQRILSLQEGPDGDSLDSISPTFDPVPTLNGLFPDGMLYGPLKHLRNYWLRLQEASLSQIESVRKHLEEDERTLQEEINRLRAELEESHDPQRMQSIQEMISVCKAHLSGSIGMFTVVGI